LSIALRSWMSSCLAVTPLWKVVPAGWSGKQCGGRMTENAPPLIQLRNCALHKKCAECRQPAQTVLNASLEDVCCCEAVRMHEVQNAGASSS
jgi:hypothetical protein